MKTKYIIIFIILIMCLSSSSLAGYYYKKKINTDKEIYNNNIDEYNKKYNMNYNDDKLYILLKVVTMISMIPVLQMVAKSF